MVSIDRRVTRIGSLEKQTLQQNQYNKNLFKKFNIRGIDTALLLDSQGKPYARASYRYRSVPKYLAHLQQLKENKIQRDRLLAEAQKAPLQKRAKLLARVMEFLDRQNLSFYYPEIKEEIVLNDTYNQENLKSKYAWELLKYYKIQKDQIKYREYMAWVEKYPFKKAIHEVVGEIYQFYIVQENYIGAQKALETLQKQYPTGESSQAINYYLALSYQFDRKEVIKILKEALQKKPNFKYASKIRETVSKLTKK